MMDGHKEGSKLGRLWCEGCFDMFHYGHANSLRLAHEMGDHLVVGVHSDRDIGEHKGPPVFKQEERYAIVRSVRWTDELVEGSPYFPTKENTLDKYNCQFHLHGDDISVAADGTDTLAHAKATGRYREFPRTFGISTTELVDRVLAKIDGHTLEEGQNNCCWTLSDPKKFPQGYVDFFADKIFHYDQMKVRNVSPPKRMPGSAVVYVSGYFDLFHIGHLRFLEAARKLGDHLVVGVYGDEDGREEEEGGKGSCRGIQPQERPVCSVYERALFLLAFRQVSEVIIGAPRCINAEMIRNFDIDLVARGKSSRFHGSKGVDCFAVPKEMGIFRPVDSGSDVTTETIYERIWMRATEYELRNSKKRGHEVKAVQQVMQQMKLAKNGNMAYGGGG